MKIFRINDHLGCSNVFSSLTGAEAIRRESWVMVTRSYVGAVAGIEGTRPPSASSAPVVCDAAFLGAPVQEAVVRRRMSRQVAVGGVKVGGGAPVSVQSMTTTVTADVSATLRQVAELAAAGCQMVRVAVPSQDDADALPAIVRGARIPVIADVHFQPRYVFAAIDAGCAAVRVNPGNIKRFDDKIAEIARMASAAGIPIRIGINAGSLDPRLLARYGRPSAEALVDSAVAECSLFSEHGFGDIKVSVKHHDPVVTIRAYRMLAERCDYPLHLGLWAAGLPSQGIVKSAVAIGALLAEGIGDTLRVGLSAAPVEEVRVGLAIVQALGMDRPAGPAAGREP